MKSTGEIVQIHVKVKSAMSKPVAPPTTAALAELGLGRLGS